MSVTIILFSVQRSAPPHQPLMFRWVMCHDSIISPVDSFSVLTDWFVLITSTKVFSVLQHLTSHAG